MGFTLKNNEVQTLMERFDREGDGEIDYREFAGWVTAEEDQAVGFGFRDIATLLREVHDIARRPLVVADAAAGDAGGAAGGAGAAAGGAEMSEEERVAKEKADESKTGEEKTADAAAAAPVAVAAGGLADKLYWPLSGDFESLSQFREMLKQRTPMETVHVGKAQQEKEKKEK